MIIAGKTFVVTGAASGLGLAVARHLLELNANVLALDIQAQPEALDINNDHWVIVRADVTKLNHIENALKTAKKQFKRIDGLVNCAGILTAEKIIPSKQHTFSNQAFCRCIEVNLIASFNMIGMICPYLVENCQANSDSEAGVIINTSSIAAWEGQTGQAAYAAAKAGLVGMMLPMVREMARYSIRVMTIAPGIFNTPLFDIFSPDKLNKISSNIPFPSRLGEPEEFAQMVQHIIENPLLNGSVIRLDGGLRL